MLRLIPSKKAGLSALILSSFATAGAARGADIRTSLGGFIKFQYGYFDHRNDDAAQSDGNRGGGARRAGRTDAEVHIDLSATSDTGIQYGGRIQLARAAKPRDNGTYLSLKAAWGSVRLGDYGGAARELMVTAPTVGIGQIDGDSDMFSGPSALLVPYKLDNDDSSRITYLSPELFGARLGLSYTPSLSKAGAEIVQPDHSAGIDAHRDVTEVALGYGGDVGAVSLNAGGAYVFGPANARTGLRALGGYGVGIKAAWQGLTLGGGYVYDGPGRLGVDPRPGHALIESVVDEIDLGLTYEAGPWGLGGSWAHQSRNALPDSDLYGVGAVYRAARGLTFATDMIYFTEPRVSGDIDGYVLILESALHF